MVRILQGTVGMSEHPPNGITAEEWTATPPAVRVLVRAMQQQVTLLEQRVQVLEEQVRQTSRTSSKPPSSDPPNAAHRPPRRPSGRPSGGQPGMRGMGGRCWRRRGSAGSWTRARRHVSSAGQPSRGTMRSQRGVRSPRCRAWWQR